MEKPGDALKQGIVGKENTNNTERGKKWSGVQVVQKCEEMQIIWEDETMQRMGESNSAFRFYVCIKKAKK